MKILRQPVRKILLLLLVLSVSFWSLILPIHFHLNFHDHSLCSCKISFKSCQTLSGHIKLLKTASAQQGSDSPCPYCVLSSALGVGIIADVVISNDLSFQFCLDARNSTSYSAELPYKKRARAPPNSILV